MKNNLWARFAIILAVVALAILCVVSYKPKLGIDLGGGTSLLYEVQVPEGYPDPAKLASNVITTLKKRIDPLNQKDLHWFVVGGRRIQLQIPMANPESIAARKAFREAETALRDSGLKPSDIYLVISKTGPARVTEMDRLAPADSPRRVLLEKIAAAAADRDAAQKAAEAAVAANEKIPVDVLAKKQKAQEAYDTAVRELLATNVDVEKLKGLLDAANGGAADAAKQIAEIATQFPAQKKQLDALLAANKKIKVFAGKNTDDPEDIQRKLTKLGKLDFRIAVALADGAVQTARDSLRDQGPRKAIANMKWFEIDRSGRDILDRGSYVTQDWGAQRYILLYDDMAHALTHDPPTPAWSLNNATLGNNQMSGGLEVSFRFDGVGAGLFADLTTTNVGRPMAILLDDRAISAPNIHTPITGGSGVITFGGASPTRTMLLIENEAKDLVEILNSGSLSAALSPEPISVQQISASFGEDNIRAGIASAVYAFLAVVAFMLIYYTITGFFANVALLLNLLVTVAIMVMPQFGATFTLPGIAGIVLTLGMAVDANILINERIREEVHKGGSLWLAVKQGYDKVFWTIFDANLTTSLTSVVLILVGSEEVKGFGVTLLIGLMIHMFTALFVTRTFMIAAIRWGILRQIDDHSISEYLREIFTFTWLRKGRWPFMRVIHVTNIDWIGKRHIFWAVSAVITVAGLVAFIARGEDKYDTEFRGGTQVAFTTSVKMPLEKVRQRVRELGEDRDLRAKYPEFSDLTDATVFEVEQTGKKFQLATTIADTPERKIKSAFLDELAKKFSDVMATTPKVAISVPAGRTSEDVVAALREKGLIVPLRTSLDQSFAAATPPGAAPVAGIPPRQMINYAGGVGIYLGDINPPQTQEQLTNRINAAKQNLTGVPARSFEVIPVTAADGEPATEKDARPLKTAVVVTSDPLAPYDQDPLKQQAWQRVAEQEYSAVIAALESRSPFDAVNSIDAVVAWQVKQQALVAIAMSLALIVIYVWIRFGGLRYGIGAILSLAHDAIVALAATVLAKYAAETWLGRHLLISDFKINLTMIAAYLTVIGYSVNDTIVIFDRIRENRGRGNHPLTAKLINDSINQCFGRTIWTTFTVFIVVLIMYIFGGEGVRGFSFAMLIGVFTGAYSTLAIASPMLLNVKDKVAQPKPVSPGTSITAAG